MDTLPLNTVLEVRLELTPLLVVLVLDLRHEAVAAVVIDVVVVVLSVLIKRCTMVEIVVATIAVLR